MSDKREHEISRRIEARLRHPYLVDRSDLSVSVDGGHVTIEGYCDQWELARMVDYMVSQVPGVECVTTRVKVRVTGGRRASLDHELPSEQLHHNVPPT